MYIREQGCNASHVSDSTIISMLKEAMRTRDVEARQRLIFDIQRWAAEQRFDYGNRSAALSIRA